MRWILSLLALVAVGLGLLWLPPLVSEDALRDRIDAASLAPLSIDFAGPVSVEWDATPRLIAEGATVRLLDHVSIAARHLEAPLDPVLLLLGRMEPTGLSVRGSSFTAETMTVHAETLSVLPEGGRLVVDASDPGAAFSPSLNLTIEPLGGRQSPRGLGISAEIHSDGGRATVEGHVTLGTRPVAVIEIDVDGTIAHVAALAAGSDLAALLPVDGPLRIAGEVNALEGLLSLEDGSLTIGDMTIEGGGFWDMRGERPVLSGRLRVSHVDLAALPALVQRVFDRLLAAGTDGIRLFLPITIDRLSHGGRDVSTGSVNLLFGADANRPWEVDVTADYLALGPIHLTSVDGSVSPLRGTDDGALGVRLTVDAASLDHVANLPAVWSALGAVSPTGRMTVARLRLDAAHSTVDDIALGPLRITVALSDETVVNQFHLGDLADGNVNGEMQLSSAVLSIDARANGIDLAALSAVLPIPGTLSGRLSAEISAQLTPPNPLLDANRAAVDIVLRLTDGSAPIPPGLAPLGRRLGLSSPLTIDEMRGRINLDGGVLSLTDVVLVTPTWVLEADGTIELDAETLDLGLFAEPRGDGDGASTTITVDGPLAAPTSRFVGHNHGHGMVDAWP